MSEDVLFSKNNTIALLFKNKIMRQAVSCNYLFLTHFFNILILIVCSTPIILEIDKYATL